MSSDPGGGAPHGPVPHGYPQQPAGGGSPYPYPAPYPTAYPVAYPQPYPGRPPLPPRSPDPLVPFSVGDWVAKVAGTVRRSARPLLLIQALVLLPALATVVVGTAGGLVTGAAPWRGTVTVLVLTLVAACAAVTVAAAALGAVATVFVVVRDAARRPYRPDQLRAFVRHRGAPAIGWVLTAALVVAGVTAALGVLGPAGVLPLLAFGLYAVTVLAALPGVIAVERAGPGRMFVLMHRRFLPALGRVVLGGLAAAVLLLVVGLVGELLAVASPIAAAAVGTVLALPIGVVGSAAAVVLYAEHRFREDDAVHTPVLADEIDRP